MIGLGLSKDVIGLVLIKKLIGYCYSTDLFDNSATKLKLCFNENESSLDDYWDEEGKIK